MASEDRILKILLQIQSDVSGLGQIKSGVEDVKKSAFSLGDAFKFAGAEEALRRVLDVVKEIPRQLEEGLKSGVEFNAMVQQLQVGFAAVLQLTQGGKFANFDQALAGADQFISTMKDKANELGLAYEAMFESVQHTQAQLANAGINDINKAIDLTVVLNRAMQSVGVSSVQAARDIGDILQGQAARTLGGGRIAPLLGMTKEELDQWILGLIQTGQLYDGLMQKMGPLAAAARAGSETFQADVNRMKNALLDLEGQAAKPLMAPLEDAMQRFSELAKTDDLKAMARTLGDIAVVAVAMARGFSEGAISLSQFIDKYRDLVSLIPGAGLLGSIGGSLSNNLFAVRTEELQKQYQLLHQQTLEADNQSKRDDAINAIMQQEVSIQEQISTEKSKGEQADQRILAALQTALQNLQEMRAIFPEIAGTAEQAAAGVRQISEALQKLLDTQSLLRAETYGTDADIYRAKWVQAYDAIKEESKRAGQTLTEDQLNQLTYERLRGPERAREIADLERQDTVQKDITAALREQQAVIQSIRQNQELISANPFLTADQKSSLSIVSMLQELQALQLEMQKLQSIKAGPLDPAQMEQVNGKIQQTGFEIALLKEKLQGLQAPFTASLMQWVNSFGTVAQQAAHAVTGTLGTAIQGTSSALTGLITGTQNWRQAMAQAATSIIQSLIQIGIQMVVTQILGRLLSQEGATAQIGPAQTAFAAWEPAAIAADTASYGAASAAAVASFAGAIAAGRGLAFLAEGGLVTHPTLAMVGEAGPEMVIPLRNMGTENLEAAHAAARSIGSGGVTSTSSPIGKSGGDVHFVGLFFDRDAAREALYDRAGRKHLIDIVRAEKIELGI